LHLLNIINITKIIIATFKIHLTYKDSIINNKIINLPVKQILSKMKITFLIILSLLNSILLINGQKISEWRPEHRTGVSAETGLLKSWPQNGPEMIWFNEELPAGFSSVTFGNNLIYLTGMSENKDNLIALDTLGKIKWKVPYGRSWNGSNPESRCTPTVEGNRVYVSSGSGDLACIDAKNGTIIWSLKASEIYKGTFGPWGIAESLIIDENKLYFTTGGPATMIIALDKKTGNMIWKSESLNDNPAYVSPILINYSGKKFIVNVSASYVFAVDPSTGKIVWKIKHLDINPEKAEVIKCVTPVYHDGKIYITGGYDHGGFMLSLTDGGNKATVAWTDKVLDVHHGGVVLLNGYIYGSNWLSNSDGNWCCIDWNTGQKKYEEHWKCKGSIISAEGLLYIYDERNGFVGLVRANPEKFDLISSFKISKGSGPYWAHPVIHNGILYIRHGKVLMAFNIKNN
jgi:outer membrane protein assembly factor BamB